MVNNQTSEFIAADINVPPFSHILYYALNVIILLVLIFMFAVPSVIKVVNPVKAASLSPQAQSIMQESFIPMYLETSSMIRLGEDFDVVLHLNSIVRAVESVDVVLEFNPEFVQLHQGMIIGSASFPQITNIESPYPGVLQFTALADPARPFQGDDEVARVAFNAQASGDTVILLEHNAGITESSQVSSGGFDVLEKTIALQLEIGP